MILTKRPVQNLVPWSTMLSPSSVFKFLVTKILEVDTKNLIRSTEFGAQPPMKSSYSSTVVVVINHKILYEYRTVVSGESLVSRNIILEASFRHRE